MKLIRTTHKQPPNVVQFECSMEMTRYDIKNYLEKIYNVNPVKINTVITMGKFRRDRLQGAVIKDDDIKVAYVILVSSYFSYISLI
jgi:large subunit ribosomal protein L23